MSWVFLTRQHAYKLKKPVRRGPVDYRTIDARRLNCQREVCLNQRLAPAVYLGIVALTLEGKGVFLLGGSGRTVDWLVKMRRLPAERTLEHAIRADTLRPQHIDVVAHRLSKFYRDAQRISVTGERYCRSHEKQIAENRRRLLRPAYELPRNTLEDLAAAQLDFLTRKRDLFVERAQSHRIVEGHGDLRPEHIYLYDEPIIVDCLEFDRELRILDSVSELAYLAMECDRLGATYVDGRLFDIYSRETGDCPPRLLITAYKCFHAYLRARIAISHLDDGEIRQPAKWRKRTQRYLELAARYATDLGVSD
jgi:aminoglycoside phosphotransferase family enzyme